jgi:hypothetical protein
MNKWLVVRPEPRPIALIELGRVVLGRVLDLILRQGDEDLLVIDVDPPDRPSWDDNLSTEDPRTGVDDDVGATGIGRRLIDLPDSTLQPTSASLVPGRLPWNDHRSVWGMSAPPFPCCAQSVGTHAPEPHSPS